MRRLSLLLALLPTLLSTTATSSVALEVAEQVFEVSYDDGGERTIVESTQVPYLPGDACYNWYVRVEAFDAPFTFVERFTLPHAIDWGTTGTYPDDITRIGEDGTVAVTTLPATVDSSGWFGHGWCLSEGDPVGPHAIQVFVEEEEVARFDFEVMAPEPPEIPETPVYVPRPTNRSVGNSW